MMMKYVAPCLALLILAGCSTEHAPPQKAQKAKVTPLHSLEMEQLCKNRAAERYNTATQKIDVTGFEKYQASYELRGYTSRNEGFVCSFDPEGQFLHLSMR